MDSVALRAGPQFRSCHFFREMHLNRRRKLPWNSIVPTGFSVSHTFCNNIASNSSLRSWDVLRIASRTTPSLVLWSRFPWSSWTLGCSIIWCLVLQCRNSYLPLWRWIGLFSNKIGHSFKSKSFEIKLSVFYIETSFLQVELETLQDKEIFSRKILFINL